MTESKQLKKKSLLRLDAYVLLFCILLLCALATYVVPTGEFERVKNGNVTTVVPGSYHAVEPNPTGFIEFFTAIQTGMVKGAPIIFLVLFTGGALAVLDKTGALNAAILTMVRKLGNREWLLVILITSVFSVLGTLGVIVNSVIAFVPLGIMIARAMKMDAIFGVALIYLGVYAGFNTTIAFPGTLGLSQEIAELPLFSGIGYRTIIYVTFVTVTILYIGRYARKVRQNNSILEGELFPSDSGSTTMEVDTKNVDFTTRHKLILAFTGIVLIGFIVCTILFKWDVNEMSGIFIFIAIGVGLLNKMSGNDIAKTFLKGCQGLIYGALIVGMARAVTVILEDGKFLDTIVYGLATVLEPLSPMAGAIGMFLGSAGLHFLISSGSGEAVMLMPLLAPLADLMGITRQVAVEALMLGEGVVNCINPTSGVLMSILAMSGISYGKWLKFMLPLTAVWTVLSIVFIVIGVLINWGPY
ncbi:YfcC family protein [Brevibacillus brevis]|uniref:YfcC family protein n=1 Tax=Brevibacillus brevis TaxID=1393 RepID=UPI001C8EA977|nr:Na+/H+ antiporter NhaC family protein [Brevibacillus brevis]MBY0087182.1 YfcC family protein [Brevibacillus brevis]UKK96744.1 YfcC family protein [Brevibacillus brevis]